MLQTRKPNTRTGVPTSTTAPGTDRGPRLGGHPTFCPDPPTWSRHLSIAATLGQHTKPPSCQHGGTPRPSASSTARLGSSAHPELHPMGRWQLLPTSAKSGPFGEGVSPWGGHGGCGEGCAPTSVPPRGPPCSPYIPAQRRVGLLLHLTFSCSFRERIIMANSKVIKVGPIPAIKMMQRRISPRKAVRKKWKVFRRCCGVRRGLSATPGEGHRRSTEYPEWDPQGSLRAAPGSARSTIPNLNRV